MDEVKRYLDTTPSGLELTMGEIRALAEWTRVANLMGTNNLFAMSFPRYVRLGMMSTLRKIAFVLTKQGDMSTSTPERENEIRDHLSVLVAQEDQIRAEIEAGLS